MPHTSTPQILQSEWTRSGHQTLGLERDPKTKPRQPRAAFQIRNSTIITGSISKQEGPREKAADLILFDSFLYTEEEEGEEETQSQKQS